VDPWAQAAPVEEGRQASPEAYKANTAVLPAQQQCRPEQDRRRTATAPNSRSNAVNGSITATASGSSSVWVWSCPSPIFDLHVGVQVDADGVDALVAEPEGDDGAVDAGREQSHGRCVPQDVRPDAFAGQRGAGGAAVAVCAVIRAATASRLIRVPGLVGRRHCCP